MKFALQKIYPITDSKLSGLSIKEQVRRFIEGGATLIQIREKDSPSDRLFDDVSAAVEIARESNVAIIVNDRVDITLMTGADAVHLGQDDMPVDAARRILGDKALIGISTHNEDQVRSAIADGNSDYIAFGPIFPTSTKADHDPLVGLEALTRAREIIDDRYPLVAIGGINAENLGSALQAGASSAAMISEVYRPESSISKQFASLLELTSGNNIVDNS